MTRNVILASGLLFALLIAAPRPADGQVRITLSAGPTFTTLAGDDAGLAGAAPSVGNETGYFAGASVSVPLAGSMSISPGLYLVQKGASFQPNFTGEYSVEVSYIEVPVTIGVKLTGADLPIHVQLFAGPEVAFEVDCTIETGREPSGFDDFGEFEDCYPPRGVDDSKRKSIDAGVVFGAEVSYGSFLVRGGLDIGLTSLDDSEDDLEYRNSAWFLGAGYVIGG